MHLDMPMDTFMAYKLQQNNVKNVVNHVKTTWSASSTDASTDASSTDTDDKVVDDMRSRYFHASKNACSHCGQNNYWCICDHSVLTPL